MIVVESIIFAGLVAFVSAIPQNGVCFKEHEVYSTCGDTCAPTCSNPYPSDCNFQCQEGCFCEPGYIRDDYGSCVQAYECRSKRRKHRCGPNEKYRRCKRTCEPTCRHRRPDYCDEPCFDYACQCRKGFVRDRHGDCIPYDLCPQRKVCGKNEVWSNATRVPATRCQKPRCDNHKEPSECKDGGLYTTNGGCVCKTGFVRTRKGKCVQPDKCYRSSKSTRSSDSDDCESTKSCGHHRRRKSTGSSDYSSESTKTRSTESTESTESYESNSRDRSSSRCRGYRCRYG